MDKAQAWHSFLSGFGWTAYDENTVPDEAGDEYITYESAEANLGKQVLLSASLWKRSTSWKAITQKAHEIAQSLGYGGTTVPFEGGVIFITQGNPFAQRLQGEDDATRRILLNFSVEFLSAY